MGLSVNEISRKLDNWMDYCRFDVEAKARVVLRDSYGLKYSHVVNGTADPDNMLGNCLRHLEGYWVKYQGS